MCRARDRSVLGSVITGYPPQACLWGRGDEDGKEMVGQGDEEDEGKTKPWQ
jgi:hypothetical protein